RELADRDLRPSRAWGGGGSGAGNEASDKEDGPASTRAHLLGRGEQTLPPGKGTPAVQPTAAAATDEMGGEVAGQRPQSRRCDEPEWVGHSGCGKGRGRNEQGLRGHDGQKGVQGRSKGDEGIYPRRGEGRGERLECEIHNHPRNGPTSASRTREST